MQSGAKSIVPFSAQRYLSLVIPAILLIAATALSGHSEIVVWAATHMIPSGLRILALLCLYVIPGLALLRLLWVFERPRSLLFRLALATSFSVALPPLLLLLFHVLHIPWTRVATWGYVVVSIVIVVLAGKKGFLQRQGERERKQERSREKEHGGAGRADNATLYVVIITLLVLVIRLFVVRDLPTGLFGDSVHHTMITQLLHENHGLFHSWQPYAPLTSFTYHFGFHSNILFIHHMTGMSIVSSVVWGGQILNVLSVPLAFVLLLQLCDDMPWAATWGAILTGFVSPMPAYYVNWGRYTQLTGHIVLVAVVVCWIAFFHFVAAPNRLHIRKIWKPLLLVGIATASLILTHYLVTVFAALFVASYMLIFLMVRRSWRTVGIVLIFSIAGAVLALLITAPWIINLASGYLLRNANSLASGKMGTARIEQYAALPAIVPRYVNGYVLLGAFVGMCFTVWQRRWQVAVTGIWSIVLILCIVPRVVGLPGTGLIDSLTGMIALYITLIPLAAYALATVQHTIMLLLQRWRIPELVGHAVVLLGILLLVVRGTAWQSEVVDLKQQMVTQADMQAMEWIREQTPSDAFFLVNAFPAFGGTLLAGTDAGWWLPLLTGRQTNLPPITYGSEQAETRTYRRDINNQAVALRGKPMIDMSPVAIDLTTPSALETLHTMGVDFIYTGATATPSHDEADYIDRSLLHTSPVFELVYAEGGVEIFAVHTVGASRATPPCGEAAQCRGLPMANPVREWWQERYSRTGRRVQRPVGHASLLCPVGASRATPPSGCCVL